MAPFLFLKDISFKTVLCVCSTAVITPITVITVAGNRNTRVSFVLQLETCTLKRFIQRNLDTIYKECFKKVICTLKHPRLNYCVPECFLLVVGFISIISCEQFVWWLWFRASIQQRKGSFCCMGEISLWATKKNEIISGLYKNRQFD